LQRPTYSQSVVVRALRDLVWALVWGLNIRLMSRRLSYCSHLETEGSVNNNSLPSMLI